MNHEEAAMRLLLIIVGAFAAIVCIEKPAEADNGRQWCADGVTKAERRIVGS
jgi:hypothetical protein